jgi:predicted transposase YdaD
LFPHHALFTSGLSVIETQLAYSQHRGKISHVVKFGDFLNLPSVRRIYLDELGEESKRSLGVGVIKLVVESNKPYPMPKP